MVHRTFIAVVLLALVATACATGDPATQAQQPSVVATPQTTVAVPPTTVAPVAAVETGADSGAVETDTGNPSEGIQVHGHWTIEVRDPDGTVASRREFENALTQEGAEALISLLTDLRPAGLGDADWVVGLSDTSGTPPCPSECFVVEGAGLTVENLGSSMRLSGAATADTDGTISRVRTIIGFLVLFTETTNFAPASVAANQTVYVEVEISFS